MTDRNPFDPVANMAMVNTILHEYRDGLISRLECKQRLIDECHIADYNLQPLLDAYDPIQGEKE